MPGFLERAAGAFFDRYGDSITDQVRGMCAVAPGSREERALRDEHAAWMATAKFGRPYWSPDATANEFLDDANMTRICNGGPYVFVRRGSAGLYTEKGLYSWDLWKAHHRLVDWAPPMPDRPARFQVSGDLRDTDPRKWTITYD